MSGDHLRRLNRLAGHFGHGGCPMCQRWRETKVYIGSASEMPDPAGPAPTRCPACFQPVPMLTNLVIISGPDDADDVENTGIGT